MRQWILTVGIIIAIANFLPPTLAAAQETEDKQAIRMLFQTEQEGWRKGDGAQILSCYAESYVGYYVPVRNGQPNFLETALSDEPWSYKGLKTGLLAPDFVGMKTALADTVVNVVGSYELNHINVKENEGVAISTIAWAQNDTSRKVRVSSAFQTMWLLRKTDGKWKYVGSVAPLFSSREEFPIP